MKEIIASGELGEIFYVNGVRVNLGLFQPDINVLWDLAPHDVSILLYILGLDPRAGERSRRRLRPEDSPDPRCGPREYSVSPMECWRMCG